MIVALSIGANFANRLICTMRIYISLKIHVMKNGLHAFVIKAYILCHQSDIRTATPRIDNICIFGLGAFNYANYFEFTEFRLVGRSTLFFAPFCHHFCNNGQSNKTYELFSSFESTFCIAVGGKMAMTIMNYSSV